MLIDRTYEPVYNVMSKEVPRMPTAKPRYTVIVDEELLKKIDDFRFENRFGSRSAATLALIRIGMEELEKRQKEAKQSPENTAPYGGKT